MKLFGQILKKSLIKLKLLLRKFWANSWKLGLFLIPSSGHTVHKLQLLYSEIKHSDWMLQVMWLPVLTNHDVSTGYWYVLSSLPQSCLVSIIRTDLKPLVLYSAVYLRKEIYISNASSGFEPRKRHSFTISNEKGFLENIHRIY